MYAGGESPGVRGAGPWRWKIPDAGMTIPADAVSAAGSGRARVISLAARPSRAAQHASTDTAAHALSMRVQHDSRAARSLDQPRQTRSAEAVVASTASSAVAITGRQDRRVGRGQFPTRVGTCSRRFAGRMRIFASIERLPTHAARAAPGLRDHRLRRRSRQVDGFQPCFPC